MLTKYQFGPKAPPSTALIEEKDTRIQKKKNSPPGSPLFTSSFYRYPLFWNTDLQFNQLLPQIEMNLY